MGFFQVDGQTWRTVSSVKNLRILNQPPPIQNFIMFGDLKSAAGVKALDEFLPSQADTAVFEALKGAPEAAHALRWYNHIKSFGAGMKQFAKASKDAATYISGGGDAPVADAGADDDED